MSSKMGVFLLSSATVVTALVVLLTGCASKSTTNSTVGPVISSSPSPTPSPGPITSTNVSPGGPGGGAIINSDSIITAQIKSITKETTGFPWQLDIFISSSQAVGDLPNPVAGKTGQIITVKTDEDMSGYKVGDNIQGKIKFVGDVPKPGITLYLYKVTK